MYISVKKKKTSPGISGLAGLVFISSKAKKKQSIINKQRLECNKLTLCRFHQKGMSQEFYKADI